MLILRRFNPQLGIETANHVDSSTLYDMPARTKSTHLFRLSVEDHCDFRFHLNIVGSTITTNDCEDRGNHGNNVEATTPTREKREGVHSEADGD